MKVKIQAFKKKDLPSKFGGGTWTVADAKFDGVNNPMYGFKLVGFSKETIANLAVGQELVGFFSKKSYVGKDGTMQSSDTFNAVDVNYVYDLILKIAPEIESTPGQAPAGGQPTGGFEDGPDEEVTAGW